MKKNKIRISVLAFAVWCALFFSGCASKPEFVDAQALREETTEEETETEQNDVFAEEGTREVQEPQVLVVHVCGAVVKPGVYELKPGSRIADAVEMAGGFTGNADDSYVNLADIPEDGMQIYIPTKEEAVALRQEPQESASSGKVNINTADKVLLCTLPGIGEARAADIIAYRQENGGFSSIEDIMKVSGIKEGSFQKIKELIAVN